MSNKKIHILKSNNKSDYFALGITSSETEFQLSLALNSFLPVKLTIATPIEKINQEISTSFSTFKFDNEDSLQLILIQNKKSQIVLYPNLRAFDFIILLSGEDAKNTNNSIVTYIKTLPNISLIAPIDLKKIGNYKNLFN